MPSAIHPITKFISFWHNHLTDTINPLHPMPQPFSVVYQHSQRFTNTPDALPTRTTLYPPSRHFTNTAGPLRNIMHNFQNRHVQCSNFGASISVIAIITESCYTACRLTAEIISGLTHIKHEIVFELLSNKVLQNVAIA